jgi:hypothetical protein
VIAFGESVFVITTDKFCNCDGFLIASADVDAVAIFLALSDLILLTFRLIKVYVMLMIKTATTIEVLANMNAYVVKPTPR